MQIKAAPLDSCAAAPITDQLGSQAAINYWPARLPAHGRPERHTLSPADSFTIAVEEPSKT